MAIQVELGCKCELHPRFQRPSMKKKIEYLMLKLHVAMIIFWIY